MSFWAKVRHQLDDFLRLVGMRDRLRCPFCESVGTWKAHGGWLDRADERRVRRWLCKWCGVYVGPEGMKQAGIGANAFWELQNDVREPVRVPKDVMNAGYGRFVNPWNG